jgi:predicted HTH domain antitoxin
MSTIELHVNDELLSLLLQSNPSADRSAIEMIVLELYRRGSVSSGKAAELLSMPKRQFIQKASALGIPLIDMTDDEWATERAESQSL